jgi:hypothetical protein
MQKHHIHPPLGPLIASSVSGGSGSASAVPIGSSTDQLNTSMAKIAFIFVARATSTTEKNSQKTPSWDRISLQARTLVLWASSINSFDEQIEPTSEFQALLHVNQLEQLINLFLTILRHKVEASMLLWHLV